MGCVDLRSLSPPTGIIGARGYSTQTGSRLPHQPRQPGGDGWEQHDQGEGDDVDEHEGDDAAVDGAQGDVGRRDSLEHEEVHAEGRG